MNPDPGPGGSDGIVAAVANRSSFVWVDEDGFRVAPGRVS